MNRIARFETVQHPKNHRHTDHRPSVEQIQLRAYEKFCARNGAAGDALTDWLDAERELVQESRHLPHKSN